MEDKHLENASVTIPYKEFKKLQQYKDAYNKNGVFVVKRFESIRPFTAKDNEIYFVSKDEALDEINNHVKLVREACKRIENERDQIERELKSIRRMSVREFKRWKTG